MNTLLLTGANSGIGKAAAIELTSSMYQAVFNALNR